MGNKNNPYLLIHGYDNMEETLAFAADIIRNAGYTAWAPHVGPYTSSWDRSCDIYAMLVGGRADYGKVHSNKYGHERFGTKEYPGLYPDWGKEGPDGLVNKINLIGHSFGGVTIRTLTKLLADGSNEERQGTDPDDLSPLFAGGKHSWVNSVTTLSSPHNGVTLVAAFEPMIRASLFPEFLKANKNSGTDIEMADAYEMDQFGFSSATQKLPVRPDKILHFLSSKDTSWHELNPEGVAEVTKDYRTYDNIYYFSFYGKITDSKFFNSIEVPADDILKRYRLKSAVETLYTSKKYGPEWHANDGLVNVISAKAPFNEDSTDFESWEEVKPGVWNVMPAEHKYHTSYLAEEWPREEVEEFYSSLAENIAALPEMDHKLDYRIEHDSMGTVKVPLDVCWGAQTERSRQNFQIGVGKETMPAEIIHAFGILKKAAAMTNNALKPDVMTDVKLGAIEDACDEVSFGKLNDQFPLVVWQTGSGTQSNMNANEVIANRANEIIGLPLCHPNDDINMSQSSNDTFPTAMHIAAVISLEDKLIPAAEDLVDVLKDLEEQNKDVVKCGRTHLQDAVPISFGQEISGWRSSVEKDIEMLKNVVEPLRSLALGGTAVGTGLNAPEGFDSRVAENISALTGKTFVTADNKFHALTSKDELVYAHGAVKALAADMMKIANDVRWLASGPRLGLGEIIIPANEPGSSIMPGKVNPTQCEQVTMVAVQVMGNDATIGMAASQGNFELNVFMPVMAYNFLQSVRLLAESINSFNVHCVSGIKPNTDKMQKNLNESLMLVTALSPYIGYENAAKTAQLAFKENITLKEACVKLGFMNERKFDKVFHPEKMI